MLRHLLQQSRPPVLVMAAMCRLTRQPSTTLARLMRALATIGTVPIRAVVTTAGKRCSAVGLQRLGHHVLRQSHGRFVRCCHGAAG